MATHTKGSYSFTSEIPHLKSGDTITGGNYSQIRPGTDVFAGIKNVIVTGGNFVNCRKPATWTIKGGNWKQISRCSWLHPKWVAFGLPVCAERCEHCSKNKVWQRVGEEPFRKLDDVATLSATPGDKVLLPGEGSFKSLLKSELRNAKTEDEHGIVTDQSVEVLMYTYEDKLK